MVDASLEVVAGDFLQRQKAVTFATVLDKGGLERWLQAGDAALVDVGLFLFLRRLFDVDVVQVLPVDDGHAQFFSLRGIDQHSLHCAFLARCYRAERHGVSPLDTGRCPIAQARVGQLGFPALRHHGRPRERFYSCFIGVSGPAAASGHGRGVARDI
ncbi:hypothetical protein D3C71_1755070 [compost metagenome]